MTNDTAHPSSPAAVAGADLLDIIDRLDGARRLVEALRMATEASELQGAGAALDELASEAIGRLRIARDELAEYKDRAKESSL
jgi:hypothetical protein